MDALLLRASVRHGDGSSLPIWPAEDANGDGMALIAWLGEAWSDQVLATALRGASPELAERIDSVLAGRVISPRDARRIAIAVAKYGLRLDSRATPFGRFAGVAPISLGRRTRADVGDELHCEERVEPQWLAAQISAAERDPGVSPRLLLAVNGLCRVEGRRLVVPGRPAADDRQRPALTSMRLTTAVAFVLRVARCPIEWRDLAEKLAGEFPGAGSTVISKTVRDLLECNVLISSLHPPATVTDPLAYVLGQLSAVAPDAGARLERAAGDAPRAVDVALRGHMEISSAVVRELEDAVEALVVSCRRPYGSAVWGDYLRRFYNRYGVGRLVPVTELIDPGTGLGLPDGYLGAGPEPEPKRTRRDELLLGLAQNAALDGVREIELTDELLTRIGQRDGSDIQVPAHLELVVRVDARTAAALDHGEFTVTVLGVGRSAGSMTGRFLNLLEPADRERFAAVYAGLPTMDPDALSAQLSFPPLHVRSNHVSRAERVLPLVISAGEFPALACGHAELDDLAVGCDSQRLYLVSLSRNRPVEPMAFTALKIDTHTPPLVRFLAEVSTAQAAVITGFDWGAARSLPYLPALRRGRVLLSAARWTLVGDDLPDTRADLTEWAAALTGVRERRRMPRRLLLADGDQHLLLDFETRVCMEVLRSHVERSGRAVLLEAPEPGADGWIGGRAHTIVVPFAARYPASWPRIRKPAEHEVLRRADGHLPGNSLWLYARLPVPADRQDHVLSEYLPLLLAKLGDWRRWWYTRSRETRPELRIRVALAGAGEFGSIAAVVGEWSAELNRHGLASGLHLDTHLPETGRWGTGEALAAAEAVFHADSQAVVSLLSAAGNVARNAVVAAGFAAIASGFLGSGEAGVRWLVEHGRPNPPVHGVDRALLAEAVRLADPRADFAAIKAAVAGPEVHQSWSKRAAALAEYRALLGDHGAAGPDAVLTSLLHVHHIRAFGPDDEHKRLSLHLARAAAQSFLHRDRSVAV